MGALPRKKFEISGSEKCISVVPEEGFAMDNGESKKPLRSDREGSNPPPPLPLDPLLNFKLSEKCSQLRLV